MSDQVCSTEYLYHYFFRPQDDTIHAVLQDGLRPFVNPHCKNTQFTVYKKRLLSCRQDNQNLAEKPFVEAFKVIAGESEMMCLLSLVDV